MSRSLCRFYSHAVSSLTASEIASQFLQRFTSAPPQVQTQYLDLNQLRLLATTLNRPLPVRQSPLPSHANATAALDPSIAIPPCHHLAYFTPYTQAEHMLGHDGSDTSYNPTAPFTRRMWAGGSLTWAPDNRLRTGQTVHETTRVLSAVGKRTRAGEDMVVVRVEKAFANDAGVAVVEGRDWVFRQPVRIEGKGFVEREEEREADFPEASLGGSQRDLLQSHVSLFRFSAVTFNAHQIHYNRDWCREVEGHRECVVHGPLNLINMVDFWRDTVAPQARANESGEQVRTAEDLVPKRVMYRATSPLYAGERYRILLEPERDKVTQARIVDAYGRVSMTGVIERC